MKKHLLFFVGLACLVLTTNAQNVVHSEKARVHERIIERTDAVAIPYNGLKLEKVKDNISITDISSSVNIFSVLMAQQHCLIYNPDLDMLMFTNRGNPGVIATGNELVSSTSIDDGATFESEISLANTNILRRYPSGIIFNPQGNTTIGDAYRLLAGPRTESNSWSKTYLASSTFEGLQADEKMVENTSGYDLIVRHGLTVDPGGVAHICGAAYALNGQNYATYCQGHILRGVYNTGSGQFEWTEQILNPDVNHAGDQTWDILVSEINAAFSPNGQIGYMSFVGADARSGDDLCSFQPIIYKSIDRGVTWEIMDYINLKNHPALIPWLPGLARDPNIVKPFVSETDMVVDNDGNAHVFMLCKGGSSDHADSLGYVYNNDNGTLFELFNQGQGNEWLIQFVDTMQTDQVLSTESGYGSGEDAVGWGHRVQAATSPEGDFVFVTWTDTDSSFFGVDINLYPDLFGWGRDLENNRSTYVVDFTNGSDVWGDNYFHYLSPIVKRAEGGWMLPVTTTDIHTTNDPDLPVFHRFVRGIGFSDGDFIIDGVNEAVRESTVNLYPNPAAEKVNVIVSVADQAEVDLCVFDLTGSKVLPGVSVAFKAGENTMSIDVNSLKSGIYFLRVSVNSTYTVRKFIVK
ncbi:MAG: hypothetical protein CVU06_00275 [Bacteroidetes bacterium HGW-Bacteroidetes-22]|nr:MAG: hypothetical protein CVU06_00275 [Bacteroidetes bacterium HGW-Bacteroidetes-22]